MHYRLLFRDSLLYIPAKVLPALTTIFFITFLFRNLSSAEYITYSVVLSTSLIIVQFSTGWIGNAILYYLPQTNDKRAFLRDILDVLRLVGGLGLVLGVVVVGLQYNKFTLILAASLLILGQMTFYSLSAVFQSERLIGIQLQAVMLQCLAQLVSVAILFASDQKNVVAGIFSFGVGFGLASFYYLVRLKQIYPPQVHIADSNARNFWGENQRKVVRYGIPLGVWFCAILFINSSDRFFLKHAGYEQMVAGYLSSKDLVVGASGLITMPLLMASHPVILKLAFDKKVAEVERLISDNIRLLAIVFAILLTVLQFFGFHALLLIFGDKYMADTDAILIIVAGLFFSCAAIYAQKGLEVEKKTMLMAILALAAGVFAIISNAVLVHSLGIKGAASAFCASFIFYFICVSLSAHRYIRVVIRIKDMAIPLVAWFLGYLLNRVIVGVLEVGGSLVHSSIWLGLYMSFILLAGFVYYKSKYRAGLEA